jgi:Ca2+-transporting ATPase
MQYAVGISLFMLILVVSLPFLQPIFNTHFPSTREWAVMLTLSLVPAVAEEVFKAYLRWKEARKAG